MSVKNTVSLISADAELRRTLTNTFKSGGITLIGFASTNDYVEGLAEAKPHGALLVDGIETLKEVLPHHVSVPVIVVVPHGAVALAVQAVKAGAFEVVEKSNKDDAVVESTRKAITTFGKLQKMLEEREVAVSRVASLTPRETQVLNLMVQGLPNRVIAKELGISPKTLDIHRSNVMDKIEARTVADLCRAHLLNRTAVAHLQLFG
jgi:two-component system, LuxR family, response regulator FixJ